MGLFLFFSVEQNHKLLDLTQELLGWSLQFMICNKSVSSHGPLPVFKCKKPEMADKSPELHILHGNSYWIIEKRALEHKELTIRIRTRQETTFLFYSYHYHVFHLNTALFNYLFKSTTTKPQTTTCPRKQKEIFFLTLFSSHLTQQNNAVFLHFCKVFLIITFWKYSRLGLSACEIFIFHAGIFDIWSVLKGNLLSFNQNPFSHLSLERSLDVGEGFVHSVNLI